jgi:hypothetical protein
MTLTVTKIFDVGCSVCEFMSIFDSKVIFDLEPSADMKAIPLETILDSNNKDPFECLIAQLTERYACNPDYTVDLPVYIVTQGNKYIGHVVGEHTQNELKAKLQRIVTDATNSES